MAFLVCGFASDRTSADKLQRYISYLKTMLDLNQDDPVQAESIRILLRRAQEWAGVRQGTEQAN